MSEKNPGLILAFASAITFSLGNIGTRFMASEMSTWGLIFLRGCLGVALVWLVAGRLKKTLWGNNWKSLSLIGLLGFLSTSCTFTAIYRIPLYQAMVLLYLYPAFAIVLSALINREPVYLRDGLWVALAIFGCVLLIWPDEAAGLNFQIGHLIGVLGSFLYGLGFVLARRLGAANSGLEPIFHYSLWAAVGAIPMAYLFGAGLGYQSGSAIMAGFLVGGLASLGQLMGYAAVRWLPAFKVGVIGTLEVFGGALASWLIFDDPMTARAAAGGFIILFVALTIRSR